MSSSVKTFTKGILVENPLLILNIGLCSALGITTSVFNGLGMGAGMTFVLVMSELVISLFRHHIPSSIRLPVFIIIIAAFTTIVQMMLQAYVPSLYDRFNWAKSSIARIGFEHGVCDWLAWGPYLRYDCRRGEVDEIGTWVDLMTDCLAFLDRAEKELTPDFSIFSFRIRISSRRSLNRFFSFSSSEAVTTPPT